MTPRERRYSSAKWDSEENLPSLSDNRRIPKDLHAEIKVLCDMMLRVHYFEEANWIWMAVSAPQACQSAVARRGLSAAFTIARELGFPRVSRWVGEIID